MGKLLGIFLLIGINLSARELTLEKTIELALKTEKSLKIYEISIENSKLDVSVAFKSALPNVVYTGDYRKSEYERNINNKNNKIGFIHAVTIYQPLFQGGAIIGGILGAKAFQDNALLNYLSDKRDVRQNAISTYSTIIALKKNLLVYESTKRELKENYKQQMAQLEMSLITKADLLKTEYSISDLESTILETKNRIGVQKLNLKIQTGIPDKEEITLKEFEVPENLTENINFERDLLHAMSRSLSARIAQNNVKIADAQAIVARANMLPQVTGYAKLGGIEKTKFDESAKWMGGVQLTWNVFSFGKDLDNYTIARNNEKIQKIDENITKDNIEINVTDAYSRLVTLEKQRISTLKGLEAATENLIIDTARYQEGLITTVDYLISVSQMDQASVAYNIVVLNYYVAFEKYRSLLI